jgi:hypothetical protein
MEVSEATPLTGQAIEIGCRVGFGTKGSDISIAHVIDIEENDVRQFGRLDNSPLPGKYADGPNDSEED